MSDVYCFGHISTGRILRLKGNFPAPDGYGEVLESLENHSGEATGGALVLARLGRQVTLEGNWIGDNPECRATLAFLRSRGIDCSGLRVEPNYQGVTELVISDGATRTVFGRYCDLLFTTRQWDMPRLEHLQTARAVCVDPAFGEATLAVAQAANQAGLPLISSDTHPDSALTAACSVLVISGEYLHRDFPNALSHGPEREELFERYLRNCPGLVIFTAGSSPLWYARKESPRREFTPFKIEVKDSAGAGDSFRAAMIHGLLENWDDETCIRYASAVAALVCQSSPGCINSPSSLDVDLFLNS